MQGVSTCLKVMTITKNLYTREITCALGGLGLFVFRYNAIKVHSLIHARHNIFELTVGIFVLEVPSPPLWQRHDAQMQTSSPCSYQPECM